MGTVLPLLITLLVAGIAATVAVFIAGRKFRGTMTKSIMDQCIVATKRARQLDDGISRAFQRTDTMSPLEEVSRYKAELEAIEAKKAEEREKLNKLESKLQAAQSNVDEREAKHNKIKMGKEDCDRIADELRANGESLIAQAKKLEDELAASQKQISVLSGGAELSSAQQEAVNEISQHLATATEQLRETYEVYQQATQRFLNLQAQYAQLESEYKGLVEQQLSGSS